jgi:hypothetical protein
MGNKACTEARKAFRAAQGAVDAAVNAGDPRKEARAMRAYEKALEVYNRAKAARRAKDRRAPIEGSIGMKDLSPNMRAYVVRQVARVKAIAVRNAAIVKDIQAGTRTVKELAERHGVQEGTIRGIFFKATGHPAPYEPRAIQCNCPFPRRSPAYRRKRALAIVAARKEGVTYRVLAERFGLTRERVRTIYQEAFWRYDLAKLHKKQGRTPQ